MLTIYLIEFSLELNVQSDWAVVASHHVLEVVAVMHAVIKALRYLPPTKKKYYQMGYDLLAPRNR
jgi:hypothetical protein